MSAESALRRAWAADGPLAELVLWPLTLLSGLFAAGAALRGAAYNVGLLPREALGVPVISVGNLAVGGTGKTPTVIALARALGADRRVGVLTRGYKGSARGPLLVSDGKELLSDPATAGDEAVLLARALPGVPVAVGAHRAAAGRLLLERAGADLLLLDDGFQHRALVRDADVVLVDGGGSPFGNGHLLPRGPLRESPCALARADAVLIRAAGEESPALEAVRGYTAAHVGGVHVRAAGVTDGAGRPADSLSGVPVLAAAGIARPERFQATLAGTGARVVEFVPYPDHVAYTAADAAHLTERARAAGAEAVAVTAKDAVKLGPLWPEGGPPLRVLEVALAFDDPGLVDEIAAVADARFAARA